MHSISIQIHIMCTHVYLLVYKVIYNRYIYTCLSNLQCHKICTKIHSKVVIQIKCLCYINFESVLNFHFPYLPECQLPQQETSGKMFYPRLAFSISLSHACPCNQVTCKSIILTGTLPRQWLLSVCPAFEPFACNNSLHLIVQNY